MGEGELGGREKRSGETPLEAEECEPGPDEGNPLWKSIEGNRGDGGKSASFGSSPPAAPGAACPVNLKIQIRCPSELSMEHICYWERSVTIKLCSSD